MSVCTGDFGTSARHLPRKRNTKVVNTRHLQNHQASKHRNLQACTALRPYAEISRLNTVDKEQASRRGARWDVERECRETKVLSHRNGDVSVYRRLRHEREAAYRASAFTKVANTWHLKTINHPHIETGGRTRRYAPTAQAQHQSG
jgi:hypothetical protein